MALDMRFDTRLIERNIKRGLITREEYEAYLKDLRDAEDNASTIELEQPLFATPDESEGE